MLDTFFSKGTTKNYICSLTEPEHNWLRRKYKYDGVKKPFGVAKRIIVTMRALMRWFYYSRHMSQYPAKFYICMYVCMYLYKPINDYTDIFLRGIFRRGYFWTGICTIETNKLSSAMLLNFSAFLRLFVISQRLQVNEGKKMLNKSSSFPTRHPSICEFLKCFCYKSFIEYFFNASMKRRPKRHFFQLFQMNSHDQCQ